jgi:SAM-dependent MidA family methyltransferase
MKFSEYFDDWLYGDGGYYTELRPIGKDGDFFTSVSTSQFFGGSIANYLIRRIDEGVVATDALVLEIGAHKGFLLKDIVTFIYTLRPALLGSLRFGVVERFPAMAEKLKEFVAENIGDAISFQVYDSLDEVREASGFVYANEIFDAFSCELLHEGKFASVQKGRVVFDIINADLLARCGELGIMKGEVGIGYEEFANTLSDAFGKLEFLTFDYGQEFARNDFSVRVYKEHKTYPFFEIEDLGEFFKSSDITIDVNFEHLTKAFAESGFVKHFFKSQMSALVDFGISELLEMLKIKAGEKAYQYELSRAKLLLSPAYFGERFKVISFTKGIQ